MKTGIWIAGAAWIVCMRKATPAAKKVAVSSTKSQLGHSLGATGGVEAVVLAMAISRNLIPPTINLENPDPECDLDYVPHKARDRKIDVAMSNSFGFGGHNASIVAGAAA